MRHRSSARRSPLFLAGLVVVALGCASNRGSKDPSFGDDESSEGGGGSSSGQATSGSGAGSVTSSSSTGSGSGTGSSSSSGSASDDAGAPAAYDSSVPAVLPDDASAPSIGPCGSNPACNLQIETCCVGLDAKGGTTGTCVMHGMSCPILTAAFNCAGVSDCPKGQVCCGTATSASAQTQCATSCPTQGNSAQGQVQLCKGNAECENGMPCIPQTCLEGSNLDLCGLTSQPPFKCTAR
jgi:hypothetical protein